MCLPLPLLPAATPVTHAFAGPPRGQPGAVRHAVASGSCCLTFAVSSLNLHERLHFLAKEADVLTV